MSRRFQKLGLAILAVAAWNLAAAPAAWARVTVREGETFQEAVARYNNAFRQRIAKNAEADAAATLAVKSVESAPTNIAACVDPTCHDCAAKDPDAPRCPPAPAAAGGKLACEQVKNKVALSALEAFLRGQAAAGADQKVLATRAAKILGMAKKESGFDSLNITDMSLRGTTRKSARDAAEFSRILNSQDITLDHQTNFGLLQISADRFVIHPKNSLAAMNRLFGKAASSFGELGEVEDAAFFSACATPNKYQQHRDFQGLGKTLATAGKKFSLEKGAKHSSEQLEAIKYIGKLLAACPRLNIELAHNEYEHSYKNKNGGLDYFETREAPSLCEEEIKTFVAGLGASAAPNGAQPSDPGSTTEAGGTAGSDTAASSPKLPPAKQAQAALDQAKNVHPNDHNHQQTVDSLTAAKERLQRVPADKKGADKRTELLGQIDAKLKELSAAPAGSAQKPSTAPAASKPQAEKPAELEQLLDRVFEQDPITLGDRANTEDAGRAEELEKKKVLRDLALKPREKVQSSDSSGLAQAGNVITSEIQVSKKQLNTLNDRIRAEKNDREKEKLRNDYARAQSNITTLETIKKELAEKKTYADQQGKAESLLKDFGAHRHFDAWGAGAFNLLDGSDENSKKTALVKIQSDMQNSALPASDREAAKEKWDEIRVGRQKAIDQSWLNSETKRIVDDLEKADQKAVGYYEPSQNTQVNAPINLTPSLKQSKLVLEIYRRQNPGNLYAPSASAVQKILLEAQAAVRAGKVKSVTEYLERPWSDPSLNDD